MLKESKMIHEVIRKRADFPKCIRHFKEIKGISIGKCIGKNMELDSAAHAHCQDTYFHQGWICLRNKYQLKERFTLLHEAAHLIANKNVNTPHHGGAWRKTVIQIGGTYKSYLSYYKTRKYLDFSKK